MNSVPQREQQNQIYLEHDHAWRYFFSCSTGDEVTVSMVTLHIVYILTMKGTILNLVFLFTKSYILICIMRLN